MSGNKELELLLSGNKLTRSNYDSLPPSMVPSGSSDSAMSMSQSEFETLSTEVSRQKVENSRRRSLSLSNVDLANTGHDNQTAADVSGTLMDINDDIEKQGRRTLYGTLPFVAAFGMQKKETAMKRVISAVSLTTLMASELQVSHFFVFLLAKISL